MTGKGFRVKVRLDLHAVTCPGVWLCPSGETALRIISLGSTLESDRVSPIFPLLFHNEFNFKRTFTRLAGLTELQQKLEQQFIRAELIQWLGPCNRAVVLATFETNLSDVLYPVSRCKRLLPGVDVDLLMDPTKSFPGIIAPKIEISTRTVIEEVLAVFDGWLDESAAVDARTTEFKRTLPAQRRRPAKGIIRQKRVCHSRTHRGIELPRTARCRCVDADDSPVRHRPRIEQGCRETRRREDREYLRGVHDRSSDRRASVAACENARLFDKCSVCSMYKCYFGCDCSSHARDRRIAGGDADSCDEWRCCDDALALEDSMPKDDERVSIFPLLGKGSRGKVSARFEIATLLEARTARDRSQGLHEGEGNFQRGKPTIARSKSKESLF